MKKAILAFALWGAGAFGALGPADRVLVIVTELKKNVEPKWESLYKFAEDNSVIEAQKRVGHLYGQIISLKNETATFAGFQATLTALAARRDVKAVDVFVHLHGNPRHLVFWDGGYDTDRIATALRRIRGLGDKLRALYSTACYGTSHGADWIHAGFRVANGSLKVNTNAAFEYPVFLDNWAKNETYKAAQERSNEPRWRKFFDQLAVRFGFKDADSKKEVHGRSSQRIDELP